MLQMFSGSHVRFQNADIKENESNLTYVVSRAQSFHCGANRDRRSFHDGISESSRLI